MTTGGLRSIAIGSLVPSPTNPRKSFDRIKLDELAASLREHGLLQPIVVRTMPFGKVPNQYEIDLYSEFWEIVAGERRYRAAKLAGLAEVPCIVVEMTDAQTIEAQVVENSQRDDVQPIEEADAFAMLLDLPEYRQVAGDPVAVLAGKLGKSTSFVYQRLKLRSLGNEARELLANGSMSASVAVDMARLQPKDQSKACKALYAAGGEVTLKTARDWIRGNLLLRVDDFKFDPFDATLLPMAGACASCPKNTAVDPEAFKGEAGGKRGFCTDPACYKQKMRAEEDRLIRDLTEKHGTCRLISTVYSSPKRKDALRDNEYDIVGKAHAGAVPAINVEPYWAGNMFEVKWIHVRENKKVTQEDRDEAAKHGKKVADLFRRNLMERLLDEMGPSSLDQGLVKRFVLSMWRRIDRDGQRRIAIDMGMEPEVQEGGHNAGYKDYSVAAESWVKTQDEWWLGQLMLRMVAIGEMSASVYSTSSHYEVPPILGGLAQECGVDALALLDEAQETLKPKVKATDAPRLKQQTLELPPAQEDEPAGDILAWARGLALRADVGQEIQVAPAMFGELFRARRDEMWDSPDGVAALVALNAGMDEGRIEISGRRFIPAEGGEVFKQAVSA